MIYDFIEAHKDEFPVIKMCEALGRSSSSFYDYINGNTYRPSVGRQELSEKVKEIFDFHKKRYGAARILEDMLEQGCKGVHKVRSLMKEQGLRAIQPKRFVPRTTRTHPNLRRSPNLLLDGNNLPTEPNQIIVGDITYLPCQVHGYIYYVYLAVWMDLFSRKIVGWYVDEHMETSLVISAFQMVLKNRNPEAGFIVHSDGGGQYGSLEFRDILAANKFRQSMTRKDDHYDNAHIESLFSRFKTEVLDEGLFTGIEDATFRSFEYIEAYYNPIRRHSALGQISPDNFEKRFWWNYEF